MGHLSSARRRWRARGSDSQHDKSPYYRLDRTEHPAHGMRYVEPAGHQCMGSAAQAVQRWQLAQDITQPHLTQRPRYRPARQDSAWAHPSLGLQRQDGVPRAQAIVPGGRPAEAGLGIRLLPGYGTERQSQAQPEAIDAEATVLCRYRLAGTVTMGFDRLRHPKPRGTSGKRAAGAAVVNRLTTKVAKGLLPVRGRPSCAPIPGCCRGC